MASATLGAAMRLRFDNGGSRRELADLLGVSAQTVSRWANDHEIPQRQVDFTPLAKYLGVSREQLGALLLGTIERRAAESLHRQAAG